MKKYLNRALQTPQNQPLPGSAQVRNSAGGYGWQVSQWDQMRRFLVLGSEGGSYYASEQMLTRENAQNAIACIQADGPRAVAMIVEMSQGGRIPRNDTAIFALALAAGLGDEATRRLALAHLPDVCRTATHLFTFAEFIKDLRGWGRSLRRAFAQWYTEKEARRLAYQLVKYRQRNGWTHRDVMRKAHPKAPDRTHDALYGWVTQREQASWAFVESAPQDDALAFVWAFEQAQRTEDVPTLLKLIADFDLPREALPTTVLKDARIWEALLEKMPMTAMIRNLGNMSRNGLLVAGSDAARTVVERLGDAERLRKARVHPINVLSALRVYAGGTAFKGRGNARSYWNPRYVKQNQDWTPVPQVVDALDTAFELAFQSIEPTGKNTLLALDVSGSMDMGMVAGVAGLTPREGAAAMAMVTARTEPTYQFTAFSHEMVPLNISAKMRLDTVLDATAKIPMGGTDCALPMLYAIQNKLAVETFVVYTDSETWFGKVHPAEALRRYRDTFGIPARLIVVGMIGNRFTIADPNDAGMLDVVGFDSSAPQIMADFARGAL